jgi:hypothetical protein
MSHLNSARSAVVSDDIFWRRIDANTPRGAKMQLINRSAGIARISTLNRNDVFHTHWFPLPKFKDEDVQSPTDS